MDFVLDTNIVIYLQSGQIADPLPPAKYGLSVISEMELLAFSGLTPAQERWLRHFIANVALIELDAAVRAKAIDLRRNFRLKLPDAIIVASAMTLGAVLLSNDEQLACVPALKLQRVRLKEAVND